MGSLIPFRLVRKTAAQWAAWTGVLGDGVPAWDSTNKEVRVGDGSTTWASLPVIGSGGGGGGGGEPPASQTVAGILEIATQAETNTGTDDARAVTPLKLKTAGDLRYQAKSTKLDDYVAQTPTVYGLDLLELADQTALMALLAAGSTTGSGILELATSAEAIAGVDVLRAVTPKALADTIAAVVGSGGGGGGATALDDLTDVTITSPATGHIPRWNGTAWVNVLGTTYFEPASGELAAIRALTSAANKLPYYTGADVAALADFTTLGRTLAGAVDEDAVLTALGIDNFVAATDPGVQLIVSESDPGTLSPGQVWVAPSDAVISQALFTQRGDMLVGVDDGVAVVPKGTDGQVWTVIDADTTYKAGWSSPAGAARKTPVGWFAVPGYISSHTAATMVNNRQYFQEVELAAGTYDALSLQVSTARVGGTATLYLALYKSLEGFPDTAAGALISGTVSTTATGSPVTASAPVVLPAGKYFVASLYVRTVGESTPPQVLAANATVTPLPVSVVNATHIGTVNDGWGRDGLSALPSTASDGSNLTVYNANNTPIVGVRRSA